MKKAVRWCELGAGLGFLTVGFLQACSLTFGKTVISWFLWPTLAAYGFVLLYRLTRLRHYARSKGFWLLCAFCLSFLVSTLLNLRFGWYENIRALVLQGILFFAVYSYADDEPAADVRRRNDVFILYYIAGCFVLSAVSFALFGRDETITPVTGPPYYIGFHRGRLFGAYWDANIGAVMNGVSAALALGLFRRHRARGVRAALCAVMAMDVLYMAFSDSRTGRIALALGVTLFVFFELSRARRRTLLLGTAAALALAVLLPVGIKASYNAYVRMADARAAAVVETAETAETVPEPKAKAVSAAAKAESTPAPRAEDATIGRKTKLEQTDISNRRFDIWKNAVGIFLARPVFGVGHSNILAFAAAELPDSYIINNNHMDYDSMHDTFLDVAAGQGLVGLVIYLAMGAYYLVLVIRNRRVIGENEGAMGRAQTAVLVTMAVCAVLMSEIVYTASPMTFIFWMSLGMLMKSAAGEETR